MKDRVAGAPGQYSATVTGAEFNKMQNGEPFIITMKRDDKPEVEGTPYSKAAVLPDEVAKRLCPDLEDPSPADAFNSLSKGVMPTVTATPDTILEVVTNARPGTTILLTAGEYGLLTFTGEQGLARAETDNPLPGTVLKYPENLTIIGGSGVTIEGISITSGVMQNEVEYTTSKEKMMLPGGLTIKGVSGWTNSGGVISKDDMLVIENSICLRNCVIDGLNIVNCNLKKGGINFSPDSFVDYYGRDTTSTADTVWHRPSAKPLISNVIVNDNIINNAALDSSDTLSSAISVKCVNNLEIYNNLIYNTPYNGIQVNGQNTGYSTGKIGIIGNTVNKSGDRGIHINSLRDAGLFLFKNDLKYQAQIADAPLVVSDCVNTEYVFYHSAPTTAYPNGQGLNRYRDASGLSELTVENGGIIIYNDQPVHENVQELLDGHTKRTDNPHNVTAEQVGAAPAGYGLGGYGEYIDISDMAELDNIKANGWYCLWFSDAVATEFGCGINVYAASMRVDAFNSNSCRQTLYTVSPPVTLTRYSFNGKWSPWGVENPPMYHGVEYRTTERFQGSAVYAKAFDAGIVPNGSYIFASCAELLTATDIVEVRGHLYYETESALTTDPYNLRIDVNRITGLVAINNDLTHPYSTGAIVFVKYIKD